MSIDREFITCKLIRGGWAPDLTTAPAGADSCRSVKPLEFASKHRRSPDPILHLATVRASWMRLGVRVNLAQQGAHIGCADHGDADSSPDLQRSLSRPQTRRDGDSPGNVVLKTEGPGAPDSVEDRGQHFLR